MCSVEEISTLWHWSYGDLPQFQEKTGSKATAAALLLSPHRRLRGRAVCLYITILCIKETRKKSTPVGVDRPYKPNRANPYNTRAYENC